MMEWMEPFMRPDLAGWRTAVVSILLAFGLTQAISGVYLWTFRGMSYSRSFVQTLVMVSIVVCSLMLSIGNNLAAGLGVAGGLSIVRFRTSLRDPRDIVFVFAALAAGIATGLQAYASAIIGTAAFLFAAGMLHLTAYGARREFDGLVRFFAPPGPEADEAVARVLKTHTRSFVLVTLRVAAQGRAMEHAYQISIPDPSLRSQLVTGLYQIEGVHDISLLLQEPTLDL